MNWGLYGILIIFGLFVLLLIFNPNLSCFGRTIRSPLYPFFRKKKRVKTEDYGFHLVDEPQKRSSKGERRPIKNVKTRDYGFNLEEEKEESSAEEKEDRD